MRRVLNFVYRASGATAALFLVAIALVVLAQVGTRVIDRFAVSITGQRIGWVVPSAAEFTGFFLAAASFLALAYTLRAGGHIRVLLIIQNFRGRRQRWFEIWCLGFCAVLSGFFTWHAIQFVLDSLEFNEMSYGIIAVPLWIPQAAMATGLVILTIALVDDLFCVLSGRRTSYQVAEDAASSGQAREPTPD